ncbi:hypothetical protein DFH27DRAFT_557889 [Peziza echinospora]|nr:hypothetical protein DFH27DRAFT_557889 [Peziza echinospora]
MRKFPLDGVPGLWLLILLITLQMLSTRVYVIPVELEPWLFPGSRVFLFYLHQKRDGFIFGRAGRQLTESVIGN